MFDRSKLRQINDVVWELPQDAKPGMQVPVRIYATKKLLDAMEDEALEQITNVAMLPGIVAPAICLPDAHVGYGFPIGGVAAFDLDKGVISPGGIGFDINCGVRLVRTDLTYKEVEPKLKKLVDEIFVAVPSGLGEKSKLRLTGKELEQVLIEGGKWAVKKGLGWEEDIERMEEVGSLAGAKPRAVSEKAKERGANQLGTLGSGNHYLEIQKVEKIFDKELAEKLGFYSEDQIALMIHCGSRGFGHQVATDYLRIFETAMQKYGISVPDRQLACAPFKSSEGQNYYAAMAAAVNFAFANRQIIMHRVRNVFSNVFGKSAKDLGMHLIYDVAHNVAKIEKVITEGTEKLEEGTERKVLVHRKGATRAFGPSNSALPKIYKEIGQPVILGGSMETGSYLLLGTKKAEKETFGSASHGSGRTMSRSQAKKMIHGKELQKQMAEKGIYVKTASFAGLAEEAGLAYKDISEVVRALDLAGISKPIVSFRPLGNIKG